jgi:hypothetical protein
VDEDVWDLSTYFVLSRSSDTKGYPSVGIGPFSTTVVIHGLSRPCLNLGPPALVVIVLGSGLMPTTPVGPGQDVVRRVLRREDDAPEEPANLLDTQREARPRPALKAARLCPAWGTSRLFFNASTARHPARSTVSRAKAHMARVIWRYQPVQLRTS